MGCRPPGKLALQNRLLSVTFGLVDNVCDFMYKARTRHGVDFLATGEAALREGQRYDPTEDMARSHSTS